MTTSPFDSVGRELGLDIGLEDPTVHRPVDRPRARVSPSQRSPAMKVWVSQWPNGALAFRRWPLGAAAAQPGHLGRRAGLIEKDQPVWLLAHARLALGRPVLARLAHVGAFLFAGPQRFFLGRQSRLSGRRRWWGSSVPIGGAG